MKNTMRLFYFSIVILILAIVFYIVHNQKFNEPDNAYTNNSSPETEAREVVYLIFPSSQNTVQLDIKEVVRESDSANLYATGIASDYIYDSNAGTNNNSNSDSDLQTDTSGNEYYSFADSDENQPIDGASTETDNADSNEADNDEADEADADEADNDEADEADSSETDTEESDTDEADTDEAQKDATNNEVSQDNVSQDEVPQDSSNEEVSQNASETNENTNTETNNEETATDNTQTTEEAQPAAMAEASQGSPIAAMYLKYASSSSGNLDYIVYVPANATASTPIFFFLHGNGEVGKDMEVAVTRYAFLQRLKDGSWQPGCIIVCPIAKKKSHWGSEIANLNKIIDEVTSSYGGSRNLMYISGASAGCDAINKISSQIPFQGAIYMAGHVNGSSYSVQSVLSLWAGKKAFYYRDNLAGGGYGYSKSFIDSCLTNAAAYGVNFTATDLNWNHSIGLVDATLLPSSFTDANGRPCQNGLAKMVYGD